MGLVTRIQELRAARANAARWETRGISHKPELAGRVHLVSQQADEVSQEMGEYADYAKVYEVYAWVHKAIKKTADAIAPLAVRVVDGDGEAVPGHPVTELLGYVNDQMNPAELWQRWVVHMYLGGESFLELLDDQRGRPVELWPRRPDQVTVVRDAAPERRYYPRVAMYRWGDDAVEIPPEQMVHDRFYNPLNQWRGMAPITAVREGVTIDLFAQAWSKLFLKRGARPDYALIAPAGLTTTEREELEARLEFKFSGSEGWHKPIVLEEGVTEIQTFSWAPKDLEWLEQRKFARDEVAAVFGVPDEIMGYGRDTYENFDTALRVFWLLTLEPLIQHRDTSLTHHFTKVRSLLMPGQRVETDLSGVGVLQDDLGPKLEQATKFWAMGVPFNVLDERLGLGIGEVPGGEIGYLPFSVTPVGGSVGREDESTADDQQRGMVRRLLAGVDKAGPEYGSPEHVARWKAYDKQLRPFEREMIRRLKRDFQRQQNEALRILRSEGEEQGGVALAWAKLMKRESFVIDVGDLLNWPAEIARFEEEYRSHYEDTVSAFGETQLAELEMGIAFDLMNPMVQDAVRQMLIKFAKDINETTQARMADEMREILVEAEEQGWSIPDIQEQIYDRVSQVFNVRKSDYETERIARTEMLKASNTGNLEGMRQSGVVARKGWLAAMDNRTRDSHVLAHSQYSRDGIPLDEYFVVGTSQLLHPGDPSGQLEEIINCRCAVIAIV